MIVEVKVPQLSESVAEATLLDWHKKEGETVARDENQIGCDFLPLAGTPERPQRILAMILKVAELARVPHTVLRTYVVTPAVALEASHPALQILRDSPHVSRIDEDALAKPFSKPKP